MVRKYSGVIEFHIEVGGFASVFPTRVTGRLPRHPLKGRKVTVAGPIARRADWTTYSKAHREKGSNFDSLEYLLAGKTRRSVSK